MSVLVIGDRIDDTYIFGTADRLCPEAPVPVVVPVKEETRAGGAALVAAQLKTLLGEGKVKERYGSLSRKERIFVGNHLICRIDEDGRVQQDPEVFAGTVQWMMRALRPELLVVSDYGKGSFSKESASHIRKVALYWKTRILVDAKYNWSWWPSAFAYFPNQREAGFDHGSSHLIHKLGSKGCTVDGTPVPLEKEHEVKDTTGAGDIFLAGFAYQLTTLPRIRYENPGELTSKELIFCAKFANRLAAESVGHLGTYVVPKETIDKIKILW